MQKRVFAAQSEGCIMQLAVMSGLALHGARESATLYLESQPQTRGAEQQVRSFVTMTSDRCFQHPVLNSDYLDTAADLIYAHPWMKPHSPYVTASCLSPSRLVPFFL